MTAATDPEKLAVICDNGESLTYGELADRAMRLASFLQDRGLRVGDVVAVVSDNSPAYLEMTWACRLAGLYFVTVNTHLGVEEIGYILQDSSARAVIASDRVPAVAHLEPHHAPEASLWLLSNGRRSGWDDYGAAVTGTVPRPPDSAVEGELLQYSSGTTGRPKGIKRPMRPRPIAPADDATTFLVGLIGVDQNSVYLAPAPLYHSAPIIWIMTAQRMGATVVLMSSFDAARALSLIEEHGVTHGQFVPTMFSRMLKLPDAVRSTFDGSTLRGVVHAAAPCPVEVKRAMLGWWGPILSEYWSSSEGAGFTFITAEEWLQRPGSVGRSLLGSLHICDADGMPLPAGEAGLIWAEGVTYSYLNDDAKNTETTSPQGWRSVGDVGRLDEDGYLYLTDRASFMIISGGVNIYPQEAENVLVEHPRVYDAAVIGLPDDDLGEVVVAVVQPLDPSETDEEFAAELTSWCLDRLAKYKCPRRVLFAQELPRSDTGKLFKNRLRDTLMATGDSGEAND